MLIETDRLIIKPTTINDVDLILKMDKQEITQEYLGGIKNKTKNERVTFIEKKESLLTVSLKDNTPIGLISLKVNKEEAELSYIFDYDYCNKGYCTESCKSLIDYAFSKLKVSRIIADTVEGNNSSKRVLVKLGFKYLNTTPKDGINFLNYELKR